MNEIEENNLLGLIKVYSNVCININEFVDFFKAGSATGFLFDPITEREVLVQGLYGHIGETKIWVNYITGPGHIRVSDMEIIKANDESKWSPEMPLKIAVIDQIERIMKLKAFW